MQTTLGLVIEPQLLSTLPCALVSEDPGLSLVSVSCLPEAGQDLTRSSRNLQALEVYFGILLVSSARCLAF